MISNLLAMVCQSVFCGAACGYWYEPFWSCDGSASAWYRAQFVITIVGFVVVYLLCVVRLQEVVEDEATSL